MLVLLENLNNRSATLDRLFKRFRPGVLSTGMVATLIGIPAFWSAGCDDKNAVQVYEAPKEVEPPVASAEATSNNPMSPNPMSPGASGVTAAPVAAGAAPVWTVPGGWVRVPPKGLEYAGLQLDSNDAQLAVGVSTFGPGSGDVLKNVVRWESQVGLPASQQEELPSVVTHLKNNGLEIDRVDLKGPPAEGQLEGVRMLAAIIPANGQVWFIKCVGPISKVSVHQNEFDSFLKSWSFNAVSVGPSPVAAPSLPAVNHPGAASSETSAIPELKAYTLPEGWTLDPQPHEMRIGTFKVIENGQVAEVILTRFAVGHFGTPEGNLTRWLGEVGLDPETDPSTILQKEISLDGGVGFQINLINRAADPATAKQSVVAQVTKDSNVYFFKLIGPSALVEQQKPAFDAFLKSVRFPSN